MTTETIEPTSQEEEQQPGGEAPQKLNITSCLLAGLGVFGVFAVGSIIPWSGLVMGFTNLAWMNPALMLGAAVGSVVMFACIVAKPRSQLGKHGWFVENAAGVLAIFSGLWAIASLMAWIGIGLGDNGPSERRYAEIMHLAPEHIGSDSRDGKLASSLKRHGKYDMWTGQEHCQAIVSMSGRDMKYSLSVNGQELGSCKNGLNVIEWKYKGD